MTTIVMNVAQEVLSKVPSAKIIDIVKTGACEGLGLEPDEVCVLIDPTSVGDSSEQADGLYYNMMYTFAGNGYETKKNTAKAIYEKVLALYGGDDKAFLFCVTYKEHTFNNFAIGGELAENVPSIKKRAAELRAKGV